jgi:hypothetical protein
MIGTIANVVRLYVLRFLCVFSCLYVIMFISVL